MPLWLQIIVVTSTLGGLLFAGFGIWVAGKKNLAEASANTSKLMDLVAAQQEVLAATERRLQNLEAIVTSHDWDAVTQAAEVDAPHPLTPAERALEIPDADMPDHDLAAQLARRLKT